MQEAGKGTKHGKVNSTDKASTSLTKPLIDQPVLSIYYPFVPY